MIHTERKQTTISRLKFLLAVTLVFLLAACGSDGDTDVTNDTGVDEADGLALITESTADTFFVSITDTPTIKGVTWYVDDSLVETDSAAPYELTLLKSSYSSGDHVVKASVSVDILDKVSKVNRTVSFTVDPTVTNPEPEATASRKRLLASYQLRHVTGIVYTDSTYLPTYRPRYYNVSPYKGWDALLLPGGTHRTYTYPDWLRIRLNRSATLVILWEGSKPGSWLSSWEKRPNVDGKQVYRKVFPAGEVVLGAIGGTENQPYTVLFAEADGIPTPAPSVPAGQVTPTPNQSCPTWVHESYQAQGPDGKMYRTWHPQIDPVYWCYFDHTHYSDPSLLTEGSGVVFQPLYNYFADKGGPVETHEGFHQEVLEYTRTSNGKTYRLFKLTHAETHIQTRACTERHAHQLVLYDVAAKEIVANIYHKPSFGPSRNAGTFTPYAPSNCPENARVSALYGARNIPPTDNGGYETWQIVYDSYAKLGISGGHTVAYLNPLTKCVAPNCSQVRSTGEVNARVWVITPHANENEGVTFRASTAFNGGGVFYTDYTGEKQLSGTSPGAVRQYIKPGLNVTLISDARFFSIDPWRYYFTNTDKTVFAIPNLNLENGLKPAP
jgi:hypothetical protein